MTNLPRISASKINKYVTCKSSYIASYLLGMKPEVETTWAILGSAVHGALEAAYKRGEFPYPVADEIIRKRFAEFGEKPYMGYTIAETKRKTYAILDNFDYDQYKPRLMEYEFLLPFYDMCTMHGFIDLITEDGRVIDYKTNSKAPKQREVDDSIQLAIYMWAYQELTGEDPKQIAIHYLPSSRLIIADQSKLAERLEEIKLFYVPEILALTADTPLEVCKNCNPFCALKEWKNV